MRSGTTKKRNRSSARLRLIILASQFNAPIAQALLRGAVGALRRAGLPEACWRILKVPGAFELPVVASRVARSRPRPDAIIALGVLIRGETSQHEVIAHAVAQGLTQVAVATGIPVTSGVIVAETLAQARARSGGAMGNRGEEAAEAALAVLKLYKQLP